MDFEGPDAADFANVCALNRAFLRLIARDRAACGCLRALPCELGDRLGSLRGLEIERLAATPFLLFSFREGDLEFWESVLDGDPNQDLFAVREDAPSELLQLLAAGLAFVWQLVRQNPFAARLICGASLYWCERIADRTFFNLLALTGAREDVVVLRSADNGDLWTKLLDAGTSRSKFIRDSAHLSALQIVLTEPRNDPPVAWSSAACTLRRPRPRVAGRPPRASG